MPASFGVESLSSYQHYSSGGGVSVQGNCPQRSIAAQLCKLLNPPNSPQIQPLNAQCFNGYRSKNVHPSERNGEALPLLKKLSLSLLAYCAPAFCLGICVGKMPAIQGSTAWISGAAQARLQGSRTFWKHCCMARFETEITHIALGFILGGLRRS